MTPSLHPLADGLPEPWAAEWGEDRFGPFMSFAVGGVVQRMRWIPPGTFLMGSPEGEAGRYDDEGPQHEVELRHGLWLGETPCTQALWQAVMGGNPSSFVHEDRPVEQVSWDDCQSFLGRLDALVPGIEARLPTEAEWEYACRGGTTSATWAETSTSAAANATRRSSTPSPGTAATAGKASSSTTDTTRAGGGTSSTPTPGPGRGRCVAGSRTRSGSTTCAATYTNGVRIGTGPYDAARRDRSLRSCDGLVPGPAWRLLVQQRGVRPRGVPLRARPRRPQRLPGLSSCPRSGAGPRDGALGGRRAEPPAVRARPPHHPLPRKARPRDPRPRRRARVGIPPAQPLQGRLVPPAQGPRRGGDRLRHPGRRGHEAPLRRLRPRARGRRAGAREANLLSGAGAHRGHAGSTQDPLRLSPDLLGERNLAPVRFD